MSIRRGSATPATGTELIRRLRAGATILLLALTLGLATAWYAVAVRHPGTAIGGWRMLATAGSPGADIYTKAQVALFGLFALDPSEAIYFTALHDQAGHRLNTACTYDITGTAPPALWWSITAYGADQFLIPNSAGRFSFNMGNIGLGPDGRFALRAAPARQDGTWLPTGDRPGPLNLMLRLYNPAPAITADPTRLAVPVIRPVGACP